MPKKLTFEEVELYIEQNSDCKLLSKQYVNRDTKMKFQCKCGNIFETNFDNFKFQNKRHCNECTKKKIQLKYSNTYEQFNSFVQNNSSCVLLSDKYINDKTPLKFKCECGNEFWTQPRTFKFQNKRQCGFCGKKEYLSRITKTTEQFKKEVYDLVGDEYTVLGEYVTANKKIKISYNCNKCNNHTWEITPSWFLRGVRCPKCSFINHSGKNNPNYKFDLTDEEREEHRDTHKHKCWRADVYKKDNYTCKSCEKYGGKLFAHHLNGYNWCREERFDINNGITLCENCHKKFHHIYGYGDNTKEQFEEFLKMKI